MHSRELVAAAALIGMALASVGVLSACTPTDKPKADPSAIVLPPENDPAALQKAAEVISAWQKKDPTTTAKVLKEQGVLVTDPAAIQAIASAVPATIPVLVASASPSPAPKPIAAQTQPAQPGPAPSIKRPSSPMS